MISLNLSESYIGRISQTEKRPAVTLESLYDRLNGAAADCAALLEQQHAATVHVPSDLMFQAAVTLFPPERMAVIGGRRQNGRLTLGASYDVTGTGPGTHRAHVEADRGLLRVALIGFERAGVELAAWFHSHPGGGPTATHPSQIDRAQYRDWTRHFSPRLLCVIFVADGHFRLWGEAVECGLVRTAFIGEGVERVEGERHVYRLSR